MTRSTRKLSEVARHLVYPDGIVTTGWPAIKQRLADMAVEYDGWQEGVAQLILGRDESGRYVATVGGVTMSLPRQVGKTFTIGSLLVAMCIEYPGLRVVWTSHHLRTTTNTFRSMQSMVRKPAVFAQLDRNGIRTANGEQEIRFANGSIIMFGAREHGFGVGIDAIDVLVCDEAQRLTSRALADMVPTTNQSRHEHGALMFFIGTPPRPDNAGDEFAARRRKAITGKMLNGIYIEMSADEDGDYSDPRQWAKANASYPHRTPDEAMQRMRENLTDDADWRREAMGVWDPDEDRSSRLISSEAWEATTVDVAPEGLRSLAIAYSYDGFRQAVAASVEHAGGIYAELVGKHSGDTEAGIGSLVRWLADDPQRTSQRWRQLAFIAVAGGGEALSLIDQLVKAGVPRPMIRRASSQEVLTANAMLVDAIRDRTFSHPDGGSGDALTASVAVCDQKGRAGGWSWKATVAGGDETPIEAVSLALWAARTTTRRPVGDGRSTAGRGSGRRLAGRR